MSQIVLRSDPQTDAALERLALMTGASKSEAVRRAIRAAERGAVLAQMRRESLEIRDDPSDRAELRAVAADLEELRAW
ncbi:MAG: ribbon-helix-helix protein, CopG family [Bifidobacteriaceae bacterium]|jgi:hypothetical protein|nr:ribbon-helix-helix protein, CopG family [Bifidobacteriaceae bacterium]